MQQNQPKELLIIGAGPYGLATATLAAARNISFSIVGKPMGLWHDHMPRGMFLRTDFNDHFDPIKTHTITAFMEENGLSSEEMRPLPLLKYLEYADWFIQKKGISTSSNFSTVKTLEKENDIFSATLESGEVVQAKKVVVAIGVRDFKFIPPELEALGPTGSYSHSSDHKDLSVFAGKDVLIVGGRQSAFETAALLSENGAASTTVVCRHPTPTFTKCQFSFMKEIIANVMKDPGWHRKLPQEEKDYWSKLAFKAGRLELEEWLAPRLEKGGVKVFDQSSLQSVVADKGKLNVLLSNGKSLAVDHIIFATGFKPDLSKVKFLQNGNLKSEILVNAGSPSLGIDFQSSVPGLYFLGMLSMNDFGFSFGFSTGAPFAAKILIEALDGGRSEI